MHAHRYTHANTHLYVCIYMQRCMHMGRFVQYMYVCVCAHICMHICLKQFLNWYTEHLGSIC